MLTPLRRLKRSHNFTPLPTSLPLEFPASLRPRRILRTRLLVAAVIILVGLHLLGAWTFESLWYRVVTTVPLWWSRFWATFFLFPTSPDAPFPAVVPGLLVAPWMGTFAAPSLSRPTRQHLRPHNPTVTPALLMLHIFSMPTYAGRQRRGIIREHSPLSSVPKGYRHLVEVKFVIGEPNGEDTDKWQSQSEIDAEQREHSDILQMHGLKNGENMNEGKSIQWAQWAQWVGRQERQAQWVLKCDDDTVPIIPNLLPELLNHDPSKPTYFGTSLGRGERFNCHYLGMMYGFSWPVIKTFASANLSREVVAEDRAEDARMGELMFSLPSRPDLPLLAGKFLCLQDDSCTEEYRTDVMAPSLFGWTKTWIGRRDYPRRPDSRTGLHYVNLLVRLQERHRYLWFRSGWRTAIGWHGLKKEDYVTAYAEARNGFQSAGRRFEWNVPKSMEHLKDENE